MKKTRAISLLLSLSLICAMLVPGAAAFAESEGGNGSGMVINKTATANNDGSYTIQLEAYATGSKIISEVTKDVPTDIVLVLDQSGSMKENMYTYDFQKYTGKSNSDFYKLRHNDGSKNLYYKLEDGSYATVSVTRTQGESTYTPTPCPSDWKNNRIGGNNPDDYWKYSNNLYVIDGADKYQKVTLTREWKTYRYVYTYTFPNEETVTSKGNDGQPGLNNFDGNGPVYYLVETAGEYTYTYTYTDKDGIPHTIGTSTGANTQPTEFTLYERYQTGSTTRLQALKDAVTSFADAVAKKAAGADGDINTPADNVNHRIAVVGFASGGYYNYNDYDYGNTEVFVGKKQYKYGNAAKGQYGNAFQDMNTEAGYNNVIASKNALDANGGTLTNLGMEMANGILNANPVPQGEQRNRVIIVFTDGAPGWSGYESDVADAAIAQAKTAKEGKVTVYTVGIFSGADATSAGNEDGDNTQKANWFMQNLSSNNGKVQTPSYYLSAGDASTLNNIFQQISDQIETGGSSTTLSSETVIKDIIAPAFTLPANATADNITLETYQCTGKNSNNEYTWSKNETAMDATAVIGSTDTDDATTTNNQVSVTGFDFAEHYVGTVTEGNNVTYRGHKLVIRFTVKPRPGFLGGNKVYTNAGAGVYENSDATKPVLTFPQPDVDVTIKEPDITLPDANVYLGAYFSETVNAEDLKKGTKVKFGNDIELDLTKPNENWGLESWQTEYVTIEVKVTDKDGNEVTNLEKLTEDTEYKVSVSIKPKTPKAGNSGYDKSMAGTIHVFKPELTFKDSEVWYGGDAPEEQSDFTGNLQEETWVNSDGTKKHDDKGVQMLNTKPTLDLTYTPEEGKIADGKVNTKQDIAVDVAVKIGETDVTDYTTFNHTACNPACGWNKTTLDGSPAFLLHVKTCQLTITKEGGADDEPYVFNIYKDDSQAVYTQVTIVPNNNRSVTIYELPVGTYTIAEDTGWSWRFPNPTYANNGVELSEDGITLSKDNASDTITCTNTKTLNRWLNGFSQVVRNIFGISH